MVIEEETEVDHQFAIVKLATVIYTGDAILRDQMQPINARFHKLVILVAAVRRVAHRSLPILRTDCLDLE